MQRGLEAFGKALPAWGQSALLRGIRSSLGPWALLDHGKPPGLASLAVTGSYGIITGSAADSAILRRYAEDGYWARATNELLIEFFGKSGGLYVDIGANLGLTTIPVAQNAAVDCYAFEPEPRNFGYLAANVSANCPHQNVSLRQVALFSRRGTVELELSPGNSGDHRLRLQDGSGQREEHLWSTVEVEALPLDEAMSELRSPLAVKVDTQGAEPFVVAGGQRILREASLLIVEWSPYWMSRMKADPGEVVDLLASSFAQVSIAGREGEAAAASQSVQVAIGRLLELEEQHRNDPRYYTDLVARK